MVREKTRQEVEEDARARAAANAMNRLGMAVKYLPSIYAKPVFDLILDAKRDVTRSEKYRDQCAARARGVNDVLMILPDETGLIAALTEIVSTVQAICLSLSAKYVEAQDISGLITALEPFRATQDPF